MAITNADLNNLLEENNSLLYVIKEVLEKQKKEMRFLKSKVDEIENRVKHINSRVR